MPKLAKPLSDTQIKRAKAGAKPAKLRGQHTAWATLQMRRDFRAMRDITRPWYIALTAVAD